MKINTPLTDLYQGPGKPEKPQKITICITVHVVVYSSSIFSLFYFESKKIMRTNQHIYIPKRVNMSFYFSKEGETQLCTPGQVSSDKADSLGVRFEFMKEGQHH